VLKEIVLNGLLRDNGLVGVSDVLTEDDATAIQGDVILSRIGFTSSVTAYIEIEGRIAVFRSSFFCASLF
jgi:hypothetical protein|tara:strand:- start:102 stop:311 length:210 start_codon:yes stop_codon:yes gene_type:complete